MAAIAAAPMALAQPILQEDFQTVVDPGTGAPGSRCPSDEGNGTHPFPSGWLLRNVDNLVPNLAVRYINDAWEVVVDLTEPGNCFAQSTSWYSPAGVANDWMWTPLIGPLPPGSSRLTWRAKSFDPTVPDGYEVRVMSAAAGPPTGGDGVIGNQISGSTVVFSTPAEQRTWTQREALLNAYAGQQIYVGFRNNTNDAALLQVDDVAVSAVDDFDPALSTITDTTPGPYAKLPAFLATGAAFNVQAEVRNRGGQTLTNVVVQADVRVNGQLKTTLTSAPLASLAPGAAQMVNVGGSAYDQVGKWTVAASVRANEGDAVPANSALTLTLNEITENEMSRAEEATEFDFIGFGSPGGVEIATVFDLPVESRILGARTRLWNLDQDGDGRPDWSGQGVGLVLRAWNDVEGRPGDEIAQTSVIVPEDAGLDTWVPLQFDLGGRLLPAGRYVFSVAEPLFPLRKLALPVMSKRTASGAGWVKQGASGGWLEFGNFEIPAVLGLSALVGRVANVPVAADDAFSVPQSGAFTGNVALNDTPSADGGNVWTVLTSPATGQLVMQPTGSFQFTPAAGSAGNTITFTYRVCDANGDCDDAGVQLQVVNPTIFLNSFESLP